MDRIVSNAIEAERDSGTLILPVVYETRKATECAVVLAEKFVISGDAELVALLYELI